MQITDKQRVLKLKKKLDCKSNKELAQRVMVSEQTLCNWQNERMQEGTRFLIDLILDPLDALEKREAGFDPLMN